MESIATTYPGLAEFLATVNASQTAANHTRDGNAERMDPPTPESRAAGLEIQAALKAQRRTRHWLSEQLKTHPEKITRLCNGGLAADGTTMRRAREALGIIPSG
jgi:hypothetical protein